MSYHYLPLIAVLVPMALGLFLLWQGRLGTRATQALGFVGFLVPCVIAVILWKNFSCIPPSDLYGGFAYFGDFDTGLADFGISLKMGINGIGLPLYLLAGIVGLAAGWYALSTTEAPKFPTYIGLLLFMQAGLMGVFSTIDIFFFYFFHEFALIPTFILIAFWGGRGRRTAAIEMTTYLTLGAMLSLAGLIGLYVKFDVQSFDLVQLKNALAGAGAVAFAQDNWYALLLFGFGILVSLFPFHMWAPRGYAAAPTPAAMLHAGVLKKFGLYGLIQIAVVLLPEGAKDWTNTLVILALGNVILIGLVTMAQRNLKIMLGYSSVMHMGYAFLAVAAMSVAGYSAAILLLFAHGLSVAALFMLSNAVGRRTGSFDMGEMGGLAQKAPVLAAFFIAAMFASIGLPGFANFWGELGVFLSVWAFKPWVAALICLGIVISAVYGLRAVSRIFFGQPSKAFEKRFEDTEISDITLGERVPALILLGALMVAGFCPWLVTDSVNTAYGAAPVKACAAGETPVPVQPASVSQ